MFCYILFKVADIVKWSPDGERYLVVINNKIDVYTVEVGYVLLYFV